jgi:hypothetical protein
MYAISEYENGPWESEFPTLENAIEIGKCTYEGSFFVGKLREPTPPEMLFNAQEWIDSVSEQDDYHEDEDWCDANYMQILELERKVRQVMTEWLDSQDLRPKFTIVDDIEEIVVDEPSQGSDDPTEPITDAEIDALLGVKPHTLADSLRQIRDVVEITNREQES